MAPIMGAKSPKFSVNYISGGAKSGEDPSPDHGFQLQNQLE